ncbi:hypothetical protein BDA99DRAFT_583621 [Phascolomyces articulosus]|uniref:Heterokaryon incompatibility domain-containing protein n=1 Tax=Phascolomyces articulosus TaxID=60185 RepID=A0AAD5PDX8_9FUNG|nr:hypothetical protein BDA99DRAFT_583621 [Phascolomyces articulosus]
MGYIIYDRRQYRAENIFTGELSGPYKRPPTRDQLPMRERVWKQTKGPSLFRPTRLVRVTDMEVIQGSELNNDEHYCTISYSWGQSGDIVKIKNDITGNDDYDCIDKGKHTIIDSPTKKVKIKGQSRGRRKIRIEPKIRHVKFQDLIQQMALDFGAKYIWYDKMCIKQDDPEDKKSEIRKMHQVYYHSLFTLIVIPELRTCRRYHQTASGAFKSTFRVTSDILHYSGYGRRSWCLEELYRAQLFVCIGQNAHFWSDCVNVDSVQKIAYHHHYLFSICVKHVEWAACTALYHAHKRVSTKDHDRIFSLANIFPQTMKYISINYDQNAIDLMLQFYKALVLMDIRLLLFGVDYTNDLIAMEIRKRLNVEMPSWVGMLHTHILQIVENDMEPINPPPKYTVNNLMSIQITSRFIKAKLVKPPAKEFPNRRCSEPQHSKPAFHQGYYKAHDTFISSNINNDLDDNSNTYNYYRRSSMPSSTQQVDPLLSTRYPTTTTKPNELIFIHSQKRDEINFKNRSFPGYYSLRPTHRLPLNMVRNAQIISNSNNIPLPKPLEDGTNAGYLSLTDDNCASIIILSELAYTTCFPELIVMPVIAKEEENYKSIGICFLHKCVDYPSVEKTQEFIIE